MVTLEQHLPVMSGKGWKITKKTVLFWLVDFGIVFLEEKERRKKRGGVYMGAVCMLVSFSDT